MITLIPDRSHWTAPHAVGLVVTGPVEEPITLDEAKLRAGLDWPAGDPRDGLMANYIATARAKVEQDTGLALLTQTRDVYFDVATPPLVLPNQCRPLQSVTSVTSIDSAGVAHLLDPAMYIVDLASARIGLAPGGSWPTDLRAFQPWTVRVVAGWATPAALQTEAPLLVQAVGLLTAHYATAGRDATAMATVITTVPYGYDDVIAPHIVVRLE